MVGKIRPVRQRLHQEAVKPRSEGPSGGPGGLSGGPGPTGPPVALLSPPPGPGGKPPPVEGVRAATQVPGVPFPSRVFAGTDIPPEALVQALRFEEPGEGSTPSGPEEKKTRSKKEKMRERRERWLSKISSIKRAKEQQAAEARRQATPVVGDMRPLADALPELSQLIGPTAAAPGARRKSRKSKVPVKRPEPTDFSQMKASQKRRLLESESSHFREAAQRLSALSDPLGEVGEQLRKRMRQEEEHGPS